MARRRYDDTVSIRWVDDECAGIDCHCGEELLVSTAHPVRCPKCQRIYQLYQVTRVMRRNLQDCNVCPYCGDIRYDDGRYCPKCDLDAESKRIAALFGVKG